MGPTDRPDVVNLLVVLGGMPEYDVVAELLEERPVRRFLRFRQHVVADPEQLAGAYERELASLCG